jgi:hypothetical protein
MEMNDTTAGLNVFGASRLISRILSRLEMPSDPYRARLWTTLVVVVIIALPPLLLSVLSGTAWSASLEIPFLRDVNTLVRLFVVVPVLVLAVHAIGIQLGVATRYLDSSSLIADSDRRGFEDARGDLARRANSLAVELGALALVLLAPLLALLLLGIEPQAGSSSWMLQGEGDRALSAAGWYFALVSRPLVGFFLLLWAWRYLAWCLFVRRNGSFALQLQPAHPDLVGGLSPLVRAHLSFVLVGFAVNCALSGAIANELLYGGATVDQVRPEIIMITAVSVLALAVPLGTFTPALLAARNRGLIEYGALAHGLSADFDDRWSRPGDTKLLDTADPSALADFGADYDTVQRMKVFALGLRQLAFLAGFLFLPYGALILTQVSLLELLKAMAGRMF